MKKPEIARSMALRNGGTAAQAADRLDQTVHRIVTNLRHGRPSPLPGLGVFEVGPQGRIVFEREKGHADAQ